MSQVQEYKEYYSPSRMFCLRLTMGELVNVGGNFQRVNEKIAQFTPTGSLDEWGKYRTNDPEEIKALDEFVAKGTGDVVTPEVYKDKVTPDNVKVTQLQRELAESKASENRLQALLASKK